MAAMSDLVSTLTAGGITCVNIDDVFVILKRSGLQKMLNKWSSGPTAVNILAEHIRGCIVAIHEGTVGWARVQQAEQLDILHRRPVPSALAVLGEHNPQVVGNAVNRAREILGGHAPPETADFVLTLHPT